MKHCSVCSSYLSISYLIISYISIQIQQHVSNQDHLLDKSDKSTHKYLMVAEKLPVVLIHLPLSTCFKTGVSTCLDNLQTALGCSGILWVSCNGHPCHPTRAAQQELHQMCVGRKLLLHPVTGWWYSYPSEKY